MHLVGFVTRTVLTFRVSVKQTKICEMQHNLGQQFPKLHSLGEASWHQQCTFWPCRSCAMINWIYQSSRGITCCCRNSVKRTLRQFLGGDTEETHENTIQGNCAAIVLSSSRTRSACARLFMKILESNLCFVLPRATKIIQGLSKRLERFKFGIFYVLIVKIRYNFTHK